MLTLDELKAAYPGCPDAVEWLETTVYEELWHYMREKDVSLHVTKSSFRGAELDETDEYTARVHAGMLRQLDTPDFARYFAAKMGRM